LDGPVKILNYLSAQMIAMNCTCSFGELLLRFSPQLGGAWINDHQIPAYIGGAELNVAQALANWSMPVNYLTALPNHYLSAEILAHLGAKGIGTQSVVLQGNRIGAYYLPQGADMKQAGVIYDRSGSSFADLAPGTLDWNQLLQGADWFHFSAISPALNPRAAAVCLEAVQAAKKLGLTVSIDLNYRAQLWQYGQEPPSIMSAFLPFCNVVMGNLWSAQSLLGIDFDAQDVGEDNPKISAAVGATSAAALQAIYPNVQHIAYTFRFTGLAGVNYFATLHQQGNTTLSATYTTPEIVDKVGSGDCFMAALIRGLKSQKTNPYTINFAAAAAVGKLQEFGDHTQQTIADIEAKMKIND
jgi:2-dehydro-3-deoxygluconokinase